jgi:hypothetical protein
VLLDGDGTEGEGKGGDEDWVEGMVADADGNAKAGREGRETARLYSSSGAG